ATALEHVEPLWRSPLAARAGALFSGLVLLAYFARTVLRARAARQEDRAYGLALTTMLLASPLCWDHYFLLLAVPLALLAVELPRGRLPRISLAVILLIFWTNPERLYDVVIPGGHAAGVATPRLTLTVISC